MMKKMLSVAAAAMLLMSCGLASAEMTGAAEQTEPQEYESTVALADGTYCDRFSERAYAMVEAQADGTYHIAVHWSSSAYEYTIWTMTAVPQADGTLTYTDCVEELVKTAEDGTETRTPANLIPSGYFKLVDGALAWTGAAEESCRECVFEYLRDE